MNIITSFDMKCIARFAVYNNTPIFIKNVEMNECITIVAKINFSYMYFCWALDVNVYIIICYFYFPP